MGRETRQGRMKPQLELVMREVVCGERGKMRQDSGREEKQGCRGDVRREG